MMHNIPAKYSKRWEPRRRLDGKHDINDLYDPDNIIEQMDEIIRHDKNKSILLAGVPGIGKLDFAKAIAKKYLGSNYHNRYFHCAVDSSWSYDTLLVGYKVNYKYHRGAFTEACLAAESQPNKLVFFILEQAPFCDTAEILGEEIYASLNKRDKLITTALGLKLNIPHNLVVIHTLSLDYTRPYVSEEAKKVFHIFNMEPHWSLDYLRTFSSSTNEYIMELIEIVGQINATLKQEGLSAYQIGTELLHKIIEMGKKDILYGDIRSIIEEYNWINEPESVKKIKQPLREFIKKYLFESTFSEEDVSNYLIYYKICDSIKMLVDEK